jgi:hypothetical protein
MKREEKYTKLYFKRLYLETGNYYDRFQVIEIKNCKNKLVLEYCPPSNKPEKILSINMKEKIEDFLSKLLKINIENWNNSYSSELYTGHKWELELYFKPSIVIKKEGSNNFPNNFNELINLIKKYYPDFIVDAKIRTRLNEDDLKKLYCYKHRGTSFTEVSVGIINSDKSSNDRRIDIVRIENDHYSWEREYSKNKNYFMDTLSTNRDIELVEIKPKLNRGVIGQIIVGEYLFKRKFNVSNISKAIVYHIGDDLLEEFCKENQIKLIKY